MISNMPDAAMRVDLQGNNSSWPRVNKVGIWHLIRWGYHSDRAIVVNGGDRAITQLFYVDNLANKNAMGAINQMTYNNALVDSNAVDE